MNRKNLLFSFCLAAGCFLLNPAGRAEAPAVSVGNLYMNFGAQSAKAPAVQEISVEPIRFDGIKIDHKYHVQDYLFTVIDDDWDVISEHYLISYANQMICKSGDYKNRRDGVKEMGISFYGRNKKELFGTGFEAEDCKDLEPPVYIRKPTWKIPKDYPKDTAAVLLRKKEDLAAGMKGVLPSATLTVGEMEFIEFNGKKLGRFWMESVLNRKTKVYMLYYLGIGKEGIDGVGCLSEDKDALSTGQCKDDVELHFGPKPKLY